ncbi:hypothetical protein Hanom_Chr06g00483511 [Helianthus anomalus]
MFLFFFPVYLLMVDLAMPNFCIFLLVSIPTTRVTLIFFSLLIICSNSLISWPSGRPFDNRWAYLLLIIYMHPLILCRHQSNL